MAGPEIVRAERPEDFEAWDRAHSSERGGLLYSRAAWAEALGASLGRPFTLLLARLGEKLAGGALFLGPRRTAPAASGPSGPSSGAPLFSLHVFARAEVSPTRRITQGVEVLSALARAVVAEGASGPFDASPSLADLRALSWAGWRVVPRYGFALDLDGVPAGRPLPLDASSGGEGTGGPLAAACRERGLGEGKRLRVEGEVDLDLLLLADARNLYALPADGTVLPRGGGDRAALAASLASVPEAAGRETIFFVGDAWEKWFGYEPIRPLRLVPVARAYPPSGRNAP